jgi:hypothetical protein
MAAVRHVKNGSYARSAKTLIRRCKGFLTFGGVLFQALTARYTVVANYPGTTLEVTKGGAQFDDDAPEAVEV